MNEWMLLVFLLLSFNFLAFSNQSFLPSSPLFFLSFVLSFIPLSSSFFLLLSSFLFICQKGFNSYFLVNYNFFQDFRTCIALLWEFQKKWLKFHTFFFSKWVYLNRKKLKAEHPVSSQSPRQQKFLANCHCNMRSCQKIIATKWKKWQTLSVQLA